MNAEHFLPPVRTLLGPGPSDVAPSVLEVMSRPLVGHLDPAFISMMEEIKAMLRAVMLTENEMTFPVSGTGSAGMEFSEPAWQKSPLDVAQMLLRWRLNGVES